MNRKTLSHQFLTVLVGLFAVAVLGTLGCSSTSNDPVSAGLNPDRGLDNMQYDLSAWPIDDGNEDPPELDETENPKLDDETENPKG